MAERSPSTNPRGWRGAASSGAAGVPRTKPKRQRIFLILASMMALAGGIAALLVLLRPAPEPYFIPLWISEYTAPQIPVNSLAEPDRLALRDGDYFRPGSESPFARQQRDQLLYELDRLGDRKKSDAVVIYLCAFARRGAKGELWILPGDFNPDKPPSAVPFQRVLAALKDCPAQHQLLVLDTMRPAADSRLGILADDVASQIPDELKAVPDSRRLVLCSCSPGQVSLTSEAMGRSVFGYYLEEGLRGWADGFNPDKKRDGHVSVRELAEYVKVRVDRWAWRNRNTRQTPVLLGGDGDFPLVALGHGKPREHLEAPAAESYPEWLQAGWGTRDQARKEGALQFAPRAFRQLESFLLRAEQEWRGGTDSSRVKKHLQDQLASIQKSFDEARALAKIDPRSLAQAESLGQKPDPGVADAVKDLLSNFDKVSPEKPKEADDARNKLLKEFLEKRKAKEFDLARAVFDQAVADTSPSPEKIRFLAKLLPTQPRYVETLFLTRLADLAEQYPTKNWPKAIIHSSLQMVRQEEEAASQEKALPWIRSWLEEADLHRHNAEILLTSPGFAAAEQNAGDAFATILVHEKTINDAHHALDEAMVFLPAYVPFLIAAPRQEKTFLAATQSAQHLAEALVPSPAAASSSKATLSQQIDKLAKLSGDLQEQLKTLKRPFNKDDLQALIKKSQRGDAGPEEWLEIEALLTTPFPTVEDRADLCNAGRDLATRLHEKTVALDHDEDERLQPDKTLPDFAAVPETSERAVRRAQSAIALLKMAGLTESETQKLDSALSRARDKTDPAIWDGLATALRLAWAEKLPRQLQQEKNLAVQNRLARIFPAFDSSTYLESPITNPCLRTRRQELAALWSWLADHYDYEAHDLGRSAFYDRAAQDYRRAASLPSDGREGKSGGNQGPAKGYLQFEDEPPPPIVTAAKDSATINLQLKLVGPVTLLSPPGGEDRVRGQTQKKPQLDLIPLMADNEWLEVTPDTTHLAELLAGGRSCLVPLHLKLKPGAQTARASAPKGFLVRATLNGRAFHHRVEVRLTPGPEILLSTNPKGAGPFLRELPPLQPGKGRLKYYLFLKSSPDKAAPNLRVELLADGVEVARALDVKLPNSKEPKLVDFGKAEIPPLLPEELRGELKVRLVNADNDIELDTKTYKVGVAVPRDSVEVTEIHWYPSSTKDGGKNRLEVRVRPRQQIPDPGSKIQLVLPGFKALPKDGKFEVTLLDKLEELYAVDIPLEEESKEDGLIYLTVDGCERAFIFKTTFKRSGAPTVPTPMETTALRLAVPRYFNPGPPLKVKVEVDNPPDGARLELSLGKIVNGAFQRTAPVVTCPQAREQRIGFSSKSPDGALLFEPVLKDWEGQLQTAGMVGAREVRAVLIDSDGKETISAKPKDVTLDNTRPTNLKFLEPEIEGKEIRITAQGEDPESGIQEVNFYVGRPDGDKPPDKVRPIPGCKPTNADKTRWSVKFAPDKMGDFDVTVEFINNVGLRNLETTRITASASDPTKPGKIEGTVVNAAGFGQIGSPVSLIDAKGKVKDETKTNGKAEFQFDKVEPGEYTVSSAGKSEKVQVEAGKTKEVTIVAP